MPDKSLPMFTPAALKPRVTWHTFLASIALALLLSLLLLVAASPSRAYAQDAAFDPRPLGLVSEGRSQAPWGMCWDFTGLATLESRLIVGGLADASVDLSEEAVVWDIMQGCVNANGTEPLFGWNNESRDSSGYADMMTGYFSTWQGPKFESDVPYYPGSAEDPNGIYYGEERPAGLSDAASPYQVTDIIYYDNAAPDEIKAAVRAYGAVATGCNLSVERYRADTETLWYTTDEPEPFINHAVAVVGWDDNFDRTAFAPTESGTLPENNGAWLVKNSELGGGEISPFFWVSYEDDALLHNEKYNPAYAIAGVQETQSRIIHGHDENGAVEIHAQAGELTCANVFEFQDREQIREIMFMSTSTNASFRCFWAPVSREGEPLATNPEAIELASGTVEHSGYETIKLTEPVSVPAGAGALILELTDTDISSIGIDTNTFSPGGKPLYNANWREAGGQSFFIADGVTTPALDMHDMPLNFSLRAFSTLAEVEPLPDPDPLPEPLPEPAPPAPTPTQSDEVPAAFAETTKTAPLAKVGDSTPPGITFAAAAATTAAVLVLRHSWRRKRVR